MLWAKAVIAAGFAMLLLGFALGVDPVSTTVDRQTYGCASVIPASWLVPGTPDPSSARPGPTGAERRAEEQCHAVVRRNRTLMWGALGVGGVIALTGWTRLRERNDSADELMPLARG